MCSNGGIRELFPKFLFIDEAMSAAEIKAIAEKGLAETLTEVRARGKLPTAWGVLKKKY